MYKTLISVLALSASTIASKGNANPGFPACPAPISSCWALAPKATASCSSLISKLKIASVTCETPSSTLTSTVTVAPKPKTTVTVWANATTTYSTTTNVNTTLYATSVTTNIVVVPVTLIANVTNTVSTTLNVNATTTLTNTVSGLTTTTITSDQTKETCAAAKRDSLGRRAVAVLPSDCSCFLTSTATWGVATTTLTFTSTPTVTKTFTIETTQTNTATWTITVPVTSTAVSSTTNLTTQTSTYSQTDTSTVTWNITTTATSTAFWTQTATTTVDPCAAAPTYTKAPSSPNVKSLGTWLNDSFTSCCARCFGDPNCVFYNYASGGQCTVFTNTRTGNCITNSCPAGKADLTLKKVDGTKYGLGPCVGNVAGKW